MRRTRDLKLETEFMQTSFSPKIKFGGLTVRSQLAEKGTPVEISLKNRLFSTFQGCEK